MLTSTEIKQMLDALPLPVFAKAADHSWIYGNQAFTDLIGLDDFIGRDDTSLFDEEQVDIFWREDDLVFSGQASTSFEEIGEGTFALTRKFPITLEDGKPGLIGLIIESVACPEDLRKTRSDYKSAQEKNNLLLSQLQNRADGHAKHYEKRLRDLERERETAQSLAQTDPMTKVGNRLGFQADLQSLSKRFDEMSGSFTLVYIDLDDFKHINDTFGHRMGDRVLCQVAERLQSIDSIFSVSRLGGDEFAVLMECAGQSTQQVEAQLQQIADHIFRPVTEFRREVDASGSLGFTRYPFDTKNLSELKHYADLALMKAKNAGKGGVRKFETSDHSDDLRLRQLEAGLRTAIKEQGIAAVYQPIVEAREGNIQGVEVLARWTHPELGSIAPDEFIFIAGRLGLLVHMDQIVLRRACNELAEFLESGSIEYFSVNASPSDVASLGYAKNFLDTLREFKIDPNSVLIEIIETAVMDKSQTARDNLAELSVAGIKIALDDFGSGYANYRTLLDLPVNVLKVDRSLINTINVKPHLIDFLVSILHMAYALGASTVCEGIETEEEKTLAETLGFDALQGFLISRPISIGRLRKAIERQEKDRATIERRRA
tara:strand:- start:3080 stop:4885 length:1806 start_codon:yes stop_codon:yes gene_type:complete